MWSECGPHPLCSDTRNERWKPWRLFDGTEVMIGEGFITSQDAEGNIYLHPRGDPAAPPTGKLPKGGFYFDNIIPEYSRR